MADFLKISTVHIKLDKNGTIYPKFVKKIRIIRPDFFQSAQFLNTDGVPGLPERRLPGLSQFLEPYTRTSS
jgi:hypothetical protein